MTLSVLLGRVARMRTALLGACTSALVALPGCAGHESRVRDALEALDAGAPEQAVAALDKELELADDKQMPAELESDDAILVLDRGMIQLWRGRYELSTRDLAAADKAIDLLDMSRGAADDLGKYLFSDDVGPYKAPAFEKLLINTMGLVGWLEQRKLEDAKVEARRLSIVQKYLRDHEQAKAMTGVGSYLAGFAFEKAGNASEALMFYEEALAVRPFASLRDPLRSLTQGEPGTPYAKQLVGDSGPLPPVAQTGECDVLALASFGRVPAKEPVRIPIGLALTLVAGSISPNDAGRANALAAKGLVTWINYPALGKARGRYASATGTFDGQPFGFEEALNVDQEVRAAYKEAESTIVLSAITRTIARMAVQETAHGVGAAAGGRNGSAIGLLVGLAAAATMTAADTPDTRGWSTLPAQMEISRFRVPAGKHSVELVARGVARRTTFDCAPGGWAFVSLTALR
jgi:hypothetical protein